MNSQIITLTKYFMLTYTHKKNAILILILLLCGFLSAQFVALLSLSNGAQAALAFQVEFYRYCLVLFSVLSISVAVANDYESGQFEVLLSMPLQRWQYIAAHFITISCLNMVLSLVAGLVLGLQTDWSVAVYWTLSFWLELMIISQMAFLAVISLEKIPAAVILSLSLYLLARTSDSITAIVTMAVEYSQGDMVNVLILKLFQLIQFILPSQQAFLSNDDFFMQQIIEINLMPQFFHVIVYCFFLIGVTTFDFYRKDFSRKS